MMCVQSEICGDLECKVLACQGDLLRVLRDNINGCPNEGELDEARLAWVDAMALMAEAYPDEKSRVRGMRATVRAPLFIARILAGQTALNSRNFRLLYGELRQACGCKRPFHMQFNSVTEQVDPVDARLDLEQTLSLLAGATESTIDRRRTVSLLVHLHGFVQDDDVFVEPSSKERLLQTS